MKGWRPVTGVLRVARDEGSPPLVVAAHVQASLAAQDAAQLVAVAAAFLAAERPDVAVPGVAAGTIAAAVLSFAGESADFAAPVLQAWPDVPADLDAAGDRGASVALAAPAEPGAPVPGVPARLASVEEPVVQFALPVPALPLDPAAVADDPNPSWTAKFSSPPGFEMSLLGEDPTARNQLCR
jgi:hypothetical protein